MLSDALKPHNYLTLGTGWDLIDSIVLLTKEERRKAKVCIVCSLKRNSTRGSLFKCGQCKAVCYCCVEHQRKDWKVHKQSCQSVIENKDP